MATTTTKVPPVSTMFSLYTSLSTFIMLFKSILREVIPLKIQNSTVNYFTNYFSSYFNTDFTFIVEEKCDLVANQTFRAAEVYLPTLLASNTTGRLLVGSNDLKDPIAKPNYGIPVGTKIIDEFEGVRLEWTLFSTIVENRYGNEQKRHFHLTCKKEFRDKIMSDYFTYIAKLSMKILAHRDNLKIHTYISDHREWNSARFQHHATFETLAIEPELKNTLVRDLDAFLNGKDFFKSVGRAWKRGYLLYGPPGTGKSSLVAAIANHMCYNIYDLQIQSVVDDAMLRQILTDTENRSILLIEDIDCCGADTFCRNETNDEGENNENQTKKKKVTLAGLLNFVDGLWSSCGEERIIIFTTNHKEKLDPALLRPGRMDLHVLMDYCTPFVFRKLVRMYLEIEDHDLFGTIEKMIVEVNVTPAEVTRQLMVCKNPDVSLKSLAEFLESKKVTEESEEESEEGAEIKEA